jgi:pyruvate-formate lyase-activating enzyme
MTIMEAFKIMSEHFDDNEELGAYIRMLTTIPTGSLDLNGFNIDLKHFADEFHEGRSGDNNNLTLDDLLNNVGLRKQ